MHNLDKHYIFFFFLLKVLHLLLEGFIYVKPQIKRFRLHWLYQELRTLAMNIVFYLSILYLQRAAEKKKLVVDMIRHFLLESLTRKNKTQQPRFPITQRLHDTKA